MHDLFSNPEELSLPGGARIDIHRGWLNKLRSEKLMSLLSETMPWSRPNIVLAGKSIPIPRSQVWVGEPDATFSYSSALFSPIPFTSELLSLQDDLNNFCNTSFNSLLVNLYQNEKDSVSWHADDEYEFGVNPIIASLSLGQSRRFQLKPKAAFYEQCEWHKGKRCFSYELACGDLMVMRERVQAQWLHCVPKEQYACKPRINLTYRYVHNAIDTKA